MTAGSYGAYGGRYVPETLIPALDELEAGWTEAQKDPAFEAELEHLGRSYAGRPTPLTLAERFAPGKRIYLKREDLLHTGAHKLNNALGQAVLARRLGKHRIVAETGAGQHGVATATVCARFGLECVVYMGSEDMRRQRPNVERMGLLGAEVRPVEFGTKTLKEATSEAIRDWITNVETTHYLLGSCVGPHPYPAIVRELQSVIGREAREQMLAAEERLPDVVVACVGGGSNAIGMFAGFLDDDDVRIVGVEARGAASLGSGRAGVLHGARSAVLADADGQILDAQFDLGRAGLPGSRAGARRAARRRARRVSECDRRRSPQRVPPPRGDRGDHPGARAGTCPCTRHGARRRSRPRLPLRSRRQGPRPGARPPGTRVKHEGARDLPHGGAGHAMAGQGCGRRRGRHPRDRHPVLRPAGRRSGDPSRRRAGARAGDAHRRCLACIEQIRALVDVPIVPMTYASILEAYGWERFAPDARAAGATSLIVVDLPAGERPDLHRIQLVAPTSTDARLRLAAEETDGWLYLVAVTGTTGAREGLSTQLPDLVERVRSSDGPPPVRRLRDLDARARA